MVSEQDFRRAEYIMGLRIGDRTTEDQEWLRDYRDRLEAEQEQRQKATEVVKPTPRRRGRPPKKTSSKATAEDTTVAQPRSPHAEAQDQAMQAMEEMAGCKTGPGLTALELSDAYRTLGLAAVARVTGLSVLQAHLRLVDLGVIGIAEPVDYQTRRLTATESKTAATFPGLRPGPTPVSPFTLDGLLVKPVMARKRSRISDGHYRFPAASSPWPDLFLIAVPDSEGQLLIPAALLKPGTTPSLSLSDPAWQGFQVNASQAWMLMQAYAQAKAKRQGEGS